VISVNLASRFFALLFTDYDLLAIDGKTYAVPKDGSIPCFSGPTLSAIALQIAEHRGREREQETWR